MSQSNLRASVITWNSYVQINGYEPEGATYSNGHKIGPVVQRLLKTFKRIQTDFNQQVIGRGRKQPSTREPAKIKQKTNKRDKLTKREFFT